MSSLDDLMKSLRADYLSSIPDKISVIELQIQAGTTASLRESFHKLKGTGSTYGMPEISALAEMVEGICREHPGHAVQAASQAVGILRDIYATRAQNKEFDFNQDIRFTDIRKLLQN